MNMPQHLTIITRTYANRTTLLMRAARSVLLQTYRPIEWLVVEDGSATAEAMVRQLPLPEGIRARHIQNPKAGRSAAANSGITHASGDVLNFLDDDDELFPDHAATLMTLLTQYPEAAGAYSAAYETPVENGVPALHKEKVFLVPVIGSYPLIWMNLFPIQSVMFNSSAVGANRFDTNLDALEDWLFWLSIFLERKLVWTPAITSRYYVSAEQTSIAARLKNHSAAQGYLDVQKAALLRERGLGKAMGDEAGRCQPLAVDFLRRHHSQELFKCYAKARRVGDHGMSRASARDTGGIASVDHPYRQRANYLLNGALYADEPGYKRRAATDRGSTIAFTSINLGYLPKALILAESLKLFHPDWQFHILLNDFVPPGLAAKLSNVDAVVPAAELGITNFHSWSFGLSVVEMCTATKPFYFKVLLEAGYEHVFYFDPDIQIFGDLGILQKLLQKHEILVTPHCDKPALKDAEILYTEMSVLAHGIYNLGFLGARNTQQAKEVIEFWRYRCLRHCHDDHPRGLFTDQKWFNLIPLYFECVHVLKHEGCNVASWNIAHRPVKTVNGVPHAGKAPLLFFHFSGYDAAVPRTMFEIFGQYNDMVSRLLVTYEARSAYYRRRFKETELPWAFGCFDNGVPISQGVRRFYRCALEHRVIFATPFFAASEPSFFAHASRIGLDAIEEGHKPISY